MSAIPPDSPGFLIGRDSAESIQSGVVNGHAIMIDGFIRNIREQYPELTKNNKFSLVSTGGLSSAILLHREMNLSTATTYPVRKRTFVLQKSLKFCIIHFCVIRLWPCYKLLCVLPLFMFRKTALQSWR